MVMSGLLKDPLDECNGNKVANMDARAYQMDKLRNENMCHKCHMWRINKGTTI